MSNNDITITHGRFHSNVKGNTPAGKAFVFSRSGSSIDVESYDIDPTATEYHGTKAREAGLTVGFVQRKA